MEIFENYAGTKTKVIYTLCLLWMNNYSSTTRNIVHIQDIKETCDVITILNMSLSIEDSIQSPLYKDLKV